MSRHCHECEGPTVACPHCRHFHCDDPECEGTPIECADAADRIDDDDDQITDADIEEGKLRDRDYEAWANL